MTLPERLFQVSQSLPLLVREAGHANNICKQVNKIYLWINLRLFKPEVKPVSRGLAASIHTPPLLLKQQLNNSLRKQMQQARRGEVKD